ncbi:unnamed protein product [Soboliphyme baturini]|uniref:Glycosyltransferase n=1 Tax=Soboliphyme baturini TaxID=241478 RepID=A0A183J1L5_9BILA|nr:unnamed protein product [Soboliphyme baturini]
MSSLRGKEQQLFDQAIRYQLDIIGLSSTKHQGSGILNYCGWKLFYSGVPITTCAQAGPGVLIEPNLADRIVEQKPIILLKLELAKALTLLSGEYESFWIRYVLQSAERPLCSWVILICMSEQTLKNKKL